MEEPKIQEVLQKVKEQVDVIAKSDDDSDSEQKSAYLNFHTNSLIFIIRMVHFKLREPRSWRLTDLKFFRVSEKLAAVKAPWEDLDTSVDASTKDEVVKAILSIPQVRFHAKNQRKIIF